MQLGLTSRMHFVRAHVAQDERATHARVPCHDVPRFPPYGAELDSIVRLCVVDFDEERGTRASTLAHAHTRASTLVRMRMREHTFLVGARHLPG